MACTCVKETQGNVVIVRTPCAECLARMQAQAAAQAIETRKQEIRIELDQLDKDTVRAIRATLAGTAVQADTDKITAAESQADALRTELAGL